MVSNVRTRCAQRVRKTSWMRSRKDMQGFDGARLETEAELSVDLDTLARGSWFQTTYQRRNGAIVRSAEQRENHHP